MPALWQTFCFFSIHIPYKDAMGFRTLQRCNEFWNSNPYQREHTWLIMKRAEEKYPNQICHWPGKSNPSLRVPTYANPPKAFV
jgi:hypothetical protein